MIMQCGVREVNAFLAWGQPPWAVQPRLRKRQASISIRLRIVGYMDHLPLPGTTASSPPQRWADMHFLFWEQPTGTGRRAPFTLAGIMAVGDPRDRLSLDSAWARAGPCPRANRKAAPSTVFIPRCCSADQILYEIRRTGARPFCWRWLRFEGSCGRRPQRPWD